ncbi:MAG TPA: response regulator transcription factor [Gemmatimonadaceae bacterium]|nr:response regulator transcription factor [Gemmatimonadaceae bacterium]
MRILVIEDNRNLARGLRHNLELEGYDVEVAYDGASGLARAREGRFDLILLDLMIPRPDGYQILRALRDDPEPVNKTAVLVLTARGEEADKLRGFRLGADDYVTKPFSLLELIARVEAIMRRVRAGTGTTNTAPQEMIEFGELRIDPGAHVVYRAETPVPLRPREFDLLMALVRRHGAVASRRNLLDEVWGYDTDVVSRTVDTHVAELRRKLESDPAQPRHILTVRKTGYRWQR